MLSHKRRFLVTLFGLLAQMAPVLAEVNADWEYIVAVTIVVSLSLIGYNVEDWLHALKGAHKALGDVIGEIENVTELSVPAGPSGAGGAVKGGYTASPPPGEAR